MVRGVKGNRAKGARRGQGVFEQGGCSFGGN